MSAGTCVEVEEDDVAFDFEAWFDDIVVEVGATLTVVDTVPSVAGLLVVDAATEVPELVAFSNGVIFGLEFTVPLDCDRRMAASAAACLALTVDVELADPSDWVLVPAETTALSVAAPVDPELLTSEADVEATGDEAVVGIPGAPCCCCVSSTRSSSPAARSGSGPFGQACHCPSGPKNP